LSDFFLVAEIKNLFNDEGYLVVSPVTDFPERFVVGLNVYIDVFGENKLFIIEDVINDKGKIYLKFRNFDNSDSIDFLINKKVFVKEEELVKLEANTYFIHDLIGCKVYKDLKFFGYLTEVYSLPANDVYVVKDEKGEDILIPAIEKYVKSINIQNRRINISGELDFEDES